MPRFNSLEKGQLTDTFYYILLSLVEAKHGYLIMKTIETMTNNRLSIGPASMYTTLKKLLGSNLIKELDHSNDRNKKTYVTTEQGLKLLKNEVQRRREMIEHAEAVFSKLRRNSYE